MSKYDSETNKEYFVLKESKLRGRIKINVYDYKTFQMTELDLQNSEINNPSISEIIVYKTTIILISTDRSIAYISIDSGKTVSLHHFDYQIKNMVHGGKAHYEIISLHAGYKIYTTKLKNLNFKLLPKNYVKLDW